MKHLLFIIFLIVSGIHLVFGQTGDIRGFVYDKKTGEGIIGATPTVEVDGTRRGAATDVNGFFSIANLPAGNYELVCTYFGYDTFKTNVVVVDKEITSVKMFLEESEVDKKLKEVSVSAERQKAEKEIGVSVNTVKPSDIDKLPSVGGEADLAQYMQVVPGVVFTGAQGGQLYIRGGSPVQNKVLLDGMTVYNPFHSIGLFSIFETDILKNVDVYTGGFNAEYGNRISAIVDVTTRDGNKRRLAGKVAANPFLAKGIFEGPIKKLNEEKGTGSSFILSAKRSHIQQTSKYVYDYIDPQGLPYGFTDLYGKVSFNAGNGSKFNLFGFDYRDNVLFSQSNINWHATGGGAKFMLVPASANRLIEGILSSSSYKTDLLESGDLVRHSEVSDFRMGMNFSYFIKEGEIKYGILVYVPRTEFSFKNSIGITIGESQSSTDFGAYVKYRKKFNNLVIEPSLRLQRYAQLSALSPEPRFGIKYNVNNWLRLKAAGGLYSQNLISALSERDIVNLFVGFLSAPEDKLYSIDDGKEIRTKLQKSEHIISGAEIDLLQNIHLNVEGYFKNFSQLININRNKLFGSDPNFMTETGKAYGIDLSAKYNQNDIYIWFTYSLARVSRQDGARDDQGNLITFPTHFDRRHNINLLTSYTFGKHYDWEASIRWNFGSGFPFTRTQGFAETIDFSGGINTNYITANGNLLILYEDKLNQGRLSTFHRLDASLKKKFITGDDSELNVIASVSNVYDRKNIFYIDRISNEKVYQLPIIPSIGATFEF